MSPPLFRSPDDGLGREFVEIKYLHQGRVQILCTDVLLFSLSVSRDAAGGRQRPSILPGGLCGGVARR
jgi:hypothetical protein